MPVQDNCNFKQDLFIVLKFTQLITHCEASTFCFLTVRFKYIYIFIAFFVYFLAMSVAPAPIKTVHKSGISSTTTTKSKPTPSPVPSPPDQTGASTSPPGSGGNLAKSHVIVEDIMPIPATSKENTGSLEKEIPGRAISASVRETPGHKGNLGASPMDLQSMLITLLMENPKGMSLKVNIMDVLKLFFSLI